MKVWMITSTTNAFDKNEDDIQIIIKSASRKSVEDIRDSILRHLKEKELLSGGVGTCVETKLLFDADKDSV